MLKIFRNLGLLLILVPTLAVHLVACVIMKCTLGVRNWAGKYIA
jgi:hypothetical protein